MGCSSKTDTELVTLLTLNNEDAFRELYLRYKDKLWHYCFSFLKSEDETEDMIQEVFIRIWEFRSFLDPALSISSFIYTVARNKMLNFFRDMDVELQLKKTIFQKTLDEETDADSDLIFDEYQQILSDAIEKLPSRRKRIFHMSRVENLSHKEIASNLGISVYTVQEHISESLRFIKAYFLQHADLTLGVMLFIISSPLAK